MKKIFLLLFTSLCLINYLFAQLGTVDENNSPGKSQAISLNLKIPFLGYLKDISNIGIGASYSWSKERFGKRAIAPPKMVGFTFNLGANYFFGEKETIFNQTVKYGAITYLHAYCGAIYNPGKMGNINLTAGPALEIYKGDSQFGFGANLSGGIYIFRCYNIGISPSFTLSKLRKSEAVLSAGIGISYAF